MQAKPKHLHAIISIMISFSLLTVSISALLTERSDRASAAPLDQVFKENQIEVQPGMRKLGSMQTSQMETAGAGVRPVIFRCQSDTNPQPVLCYGPYQMREAYGVTELLNKQITGHGSTITIIDAYGSPTIRGDLQKFDNVWGLPAPQFNIVTPFGVRGADNTWAAETSLDVEWAHVMAPGAAINLVLARSSSDADLYKALLYTVQQNLGDIVSMSFGENENCVDPKLRKAEHRLMKEAVLKKMTILAATGDLGSAQLTCSRSAYERAISFPSDDPFVTAVGGTALSADAITGHYISETAWNESNAFNKAAGGGYSDLYTDPSYQKHITGAARGRGVPDLSMNAAVAGGVLVYQGNRDTGHTMVNIMGGTSAAAPELAGILADGIQMAHHRLGPINAELYKLGASSLYKDSMNDITVGNNGLTSSGLNGYTAGTGWDPATGWGSPRQAEAFLQGLIHQGES